MEQGVQTQRGKGEFYIFLSMAYKKVPKAALDPSSPAAWIRVPSCWLYTLPRDIG